GQRSVVHADDVPIVVSANNHGRLPLGLPFPSVPAPRASEAPGRHLLTAPARRPSRPVKRPGPARPLCERKAFLRQLTLSHHPATAEEGLQPASRRPARAAPPRPPAPPGRL